MKTIIKTITADPDNYLDLLFACPALIGVWAGGHGGGGAKITWNFFCYVRKIL
jgi:hypothetical protein